MFNYKRDFNESTVKAINKIKSDLNIECNVYYLDDFEVEKFKPNMINGVFLNYLEAKQVGLDDNSVIVNMRYRKLFGDIYIEGTIAHELRHCFQFMNQDKNPVWKKEFAITQSKVGYENTRTLSIEIDAIWYQEYYLLSNYNKHLALPKKLRDIVNNYKPKI